MNLIYIYGPPGVGKYTVGKELSKITGYKLFHNQLSIEFVLSVFEFGTPAFNKLVLKFRAEIIEEAARNNVSLIFTSGYAKGYNEDIMKDIVNRVEKHKGKVYFVQLFCEKKELMKRIGNPSRKSFHKIRSRTFMEKILKRYNHFSSIPFRKSLFIDNTRRNPKDVAREIASHYKLGK
ncbi:MAG: AAA family ATPase [Candidatus Marsarchaeota archaeon]|nr:AAA family ATPase [Candidatus Marsarchaeota archaeon]